MKVAEIEFGKWYRAYYQPRPLSRKSHRRPLDIEVKPVEHLGRGWLDCIRKDGSKTRARAAWLSELE